MIGCMSLHFVDAGANGLIKGGSGVGKTMIAQNLGLAARKRRMPFLRIRDAVCSLERLLRCLGSGRQLTQSIRTRSLIPTRIVSAGEEVVRRVCPHMTIGARHAVVDNAWPNAVGQWRRRSVWRKCMCRVCVGAGVSGDEPNRRGSRAERAVNFATLASRWHARCTSQRS
jgi:hypothetical protein